jgi:hypothetical protein
MNEYQRELVRHLVDTKEMDGKRVWVPSYKMLVEKTVKTDPMLEAMFAIEEINLN